jgi:outer membrane protein TolC
MKFIKKRYRSMLRNLSLVCLLLLALSGRGQEDLSLLDAIRIGLENNYQIKISEQQLEIARNNNALGTTGIWPTISLGINETNRFDNMPSQDPALERNRFFTNAFVPYVNARWTLFRGLGAIISKKQLALLEQFTEGNATIVVENTMQGIILAYYQVLLDQEKLDILDEVKQLSGDRFDYMEFKQELGGAVTYDVIQAKNSFLSDSTNYLLQELNLRNSNLVLKLLLGVPPDTEYTLTEEFKVETYDYELEALMDTMLSNNYTIRNQYINQEILRKDISLAKADVWPTLSVNTGLDQFNVRTQNLDESASFSNNLDFYANFSLNFNLYDGGRVKRAIQNARINEEIGKLEILDLERSLRNVMVNNYELYNIRKQLYEVAEVNLESNRLNLQISTDKYRAGAINSFNYRDVQLQFLNASFNQLEAVYNLIDTEVELLRLTGGLITSY